LPPARLLPAALAGIPLAFAAMSPARADPADGPPVQQLAPVSVTATRLPTATDELGSSVTIVSGEEIEQRQLRTLSDALRDVPGLGLVQAGGPGGQTSIFIRGTGPNHAKVLIDGMPATDPSTSNGAFNFGPFGAADIERIEVLRGPQSGLYGSDAIGGVVNVVTKRGSGPPHLDAALEGGSFATFNQFGALSGGGERYHYAVNVGHLRSDDTPVTPLALLPPGRARIGDASESTTLSTKLGADLDDSFGATLVARYVDSFLRFTGDDLTVFPSVPAAEQSRAETRQFLTRGEARLASFGDVLEQRVGVGYVDYRTRLQEPDAGPTFARGDRVRLDWLGTVRLAEGHTLLLGAEREREELRDSPISAYNVNDAGFLELQSGFAGRFFATAAVRLDANESFGDVVTWRFAPAFLVRETGTRLKGSVGTGFKAPTLSQLFVDFPAFGFFANPNLRPERSLGWDAGFEQSLLDGRLGFGATYFHNDIDQLITPDASFTTLENRPAATTYGAESFLAFRPFDALELRADYTYTLAFDGATHEELLRRPRHKASLAVAWRPAERLSLSLTTLHVGSRIDGNRDFSVPRLEADAYTTVNLAGAYELDETVAAFARIDNLLDRSYEDPTGFQRPGLGIFVGVRLRLDAPRP
jgi:vitamin B12 transporter